jgi:archaeosine synthase
LKEIKNYLTNVEIILKNHPDLNFGLSLKIFEYPELLEHYIKFIKKFENIKVICLIDLFDNFSNFRNILRCIINIKTDLDNNIVIMASGRIIPKYYPILIYIGIDLIDASYLLFLSAENYYDTIEHLLPLHKIKYLPCSCVVCKDHLKEMLHVKVSSEKIDLLSLHNLLTANIYMNKIKQYLNYEDYRAFTEKSSFDDTRLISMIKVLDKEWFDILKYETPMWQNYKKIQCFGSLSYNRPDFQQFRERLIKNFEPEPWTSLILLVPCSAKKPYSESRSHKKLYNVIRKFPEFPSFQEFIITSPLGCIPRQLENIYPVNSYDISVTGDWDDEEYSITSNMLINILEKYDSNIPVICHLDKEYVEIIKRASKNLAHKFIFTEITDRITSFESLQSLEDKINEFKDSFEVKPSLKKEDYSRTWTRKFLKILDYQFGIGTGIKIIMNKIKPIHVRHAEKINLIDSNTREKLGTFKFSTGQIILTHNGLRRLFKSRDPKSNYIVFDGEQIQGNTLFRTGIIDYSHDLIPNNQVLILNKNKKEVLGSGELIVGSNFLKNSKSGRIVKINDKN